MSGAPGDEEIRAAVRRFLLSKVLSPEDAEALGDDTPLVTGGILDSIATLQLVVFLEEEIGVSVPAHEVSVDNFDTVGAIVRLVRSKLGSAKPAG